MTWESLILNAKHRPGKPRGYGGWVLQVTRAMTIMLHAKKTSHRVSFLMMIGIIPLL
jgi:hypothetical protein